MPGETTTGTLSDALPSIIGQARLVREYAGTWMRTTEHHRQKAGTGLDWQEFALDQLQASDITETTRNENFQQLSGTLLEIEPDMTQILVKITDRTYRKIADVVEDKMGTLAGNGMARKKDEDYLDLASTMGTTVSPGTGNPLSHGHIAAAVNNVQSNVTEPSEAEVFTVVHGFQMYDIDSELKAPVGTYPLPEGMTAETFKKGYKGMVGGSNVFTDGNITVDATPDANGMVHARDGVLAIDGMEIKKATRYDPSYGGGADEIFLTDEYAFAIRLSNWCYLLKSDATAPTG